jgi:phosphate:Na+ symporter
MKKHDATVNGVIDKLIREDLISAEMATSLMNDSSYAYDVARNLIDMGTILFGEHDPMISDAERAVALDEDDIEELVKGEME